MLRCQQRLRKKMQKNTKSDNKLKYGEEIYLQDVLKHIENTYSEHYASPIEGSDFQYMDNVMNDDIGAGFLKFSAMKYLSRYGKKAGNNKKDLLKAIHMTILLMHKMELKEKK